MDISVERNALTRHLAYEGRIAVKPESAGLSAARRLVSMIAKDLYLEYDEVCDLMLAVGEAISNAYVYGCPNRTKNLIYIGWKFADDVLTVVIEDEGPGFSLNDVPVYPCLTDLHYRQGISIMHQSVDEVDFDFKNGTRVVLKKKASSQQMCA